MDEIEILVASAPDREEVVAEIWLGGAMFAEIRSEGGTFLVEVDNRREPGLWSLKFITLLDTLVEAKRRLRPDATSRAPGGGEPPRREAMTAAPCGAVEPVLPAVQPRSGGAVQTSALRRP